MPTHTQQLICLVRFAVLAADTRRGKVLRTCGFAART